MDEKKRLELITRNTEEIIKKEELIELLKTKKTPVVYCGYETSGEVHLGHAVTVTKLIDLQKAGFKVKVLFADWHTWLNRKGDWDFIEKTIKTWEKAFRSMGLTDAEFVKGSSFQRNMKYMDDILLMSLDTTINRALRSMQEVARDIEHAHVSQVIYPFMQIEDMKALKVDVALGGIEQRKIHMMGRELADTIGYKPVVCLHTPLIPSLQGPGGKMSSSKPETMISVKDSEKDIRSKINKAHCIAGVIEDNPVMSIARLLVFPHTDRFVIDRPEKYGGNLEYSNYKELEKAFIENKIHPLDLKNGVAEEIIKIFEPVRKHFL